MYIYYYCYSSLIIYFVCFYLFYSKRSLCDLHNKIFGVMLWVSMLACIFEIIKAKAIEGIPFNQVGYLYFTDTIYYIFENAIAFIFAGYIITMTDKLNHMNVYKKLAAYVPICISELIIITNSWTKAVFNIDQNGKYSSGIGLQVLHVIAGYYLLCIIVYFIKYKNYVTKQMKYASIVYILMLIVPILVQKCFPSILILNFGIATCELLLLLIVQNTDELLDGETGMFHYDAFLQVTQLNFKNKELFHVTFIKLADRVLINQTFGMNYLAGVIAAVGVYLQATSKMSLNYYLGDGLFAIITDEKISVEVRNQLIDKILNRFQRKWAVLDIEILLSVQVFDLKCPEDASDVNDTLDYIEYLKNDEKMLKNYCLEYHNKFASAKDVGLNDKKNQIEFKRIIWESLEKEKYQVYYQPIYSTEEKRIVSAEVVIRLNDANPIFISPEELLEVLNYNVIFANMSMNIFDQVCSFLKKNELTKNGINLINTDLSVVHCMQEKLIDILKTITETHGIQFSQICFEITETTAVYFQQIIKQNLFDLHNMGATFLLDKYGIGCSNLGYLLDIPFRYVKLDKSIVRAYFESEKGSVILKSTITMMKHLNIKIIAEDIKSVEEVNLLTELGVELLQGSYFSKAISQDEFQLLINKERAISKNPFNY